MNQPQTSARLLERIKQLTARARAAHRRSSQEWTRRIESPDVRRDLG